MIIHHGISNSLCTVKRWHPHIVGFCILVFMVLSCESNLKYKVAQKSGATSGVIETIEGTVKPVTSLSLSETCAESPRIDLLLLKRQNGEVLAEPEVLAQGKVDSNGVYSFSELGGLNIDLKANPSFYGIAFTQCETYFTTTLTSSKNQDITYGSTLFSYGFNLDEVKLDAVDSKSLGLVETSLKELNSQTSFADAYQYLSETPQAAEKFQDLYGVSPRRLLFVAPKILAINVPNNVTEVEETTLSITASHWLDSYKIGYLWQWNNAAIGSNASLKHRFSANSQGETSITLSVGERGDENPLNSLRPFRQVTRKITIANTRLPVAPRMTMRNGLTTSTTRTLGLAIATGANLSNCESFSKLAITENETDAPIASDFVITCRDGGSQDVSFTLSTAGNGVKTLRLWAMDASGTISKSSSELSVTLAEGSANVVPTLAIIEPAGGNDLQSPGSTYSISYIANDPDDVATVALYHKASSSGGCSDGSLSGWTLIASGLGEGAPASHNWATTALASGDYFICAKVSDSTNSAVYAVSSSYLRLNASPSFTYTTPPVTHSNVVLGNAFSVDFTASDLEENAAINLYVRTSSAGCNATDISAWTAVATSLDEDNDTSAGFTAGSLGNYYFCAKIADGINPDSYVLSPGYLSVTNNAVPALTFSEPVGNNDTIAIDGSFNITFTAADADSSAAIALYYKATASTSCTDGTLTGWTAVATGMSEDSDTSTLFDTTGLSTGDYYICAQIDDSVNTPVYRLASGKLTIADQTTPTAGNSGAITTSAVASATLTLDWTAATDNVSAAANLKYRVYYSTANNIATKANVTGNGTALNAYTSNITTFNVSGLTPSTAYYFNVLVEDEAGNVTAYTSSTATTTADSTGPVAGNSGTVTTASITVTGLTLNWTTASDDVTAASSLQYRVYRSTSNNITTAADAVTNGTAVNSYTANIATLAVSALSPATTYYFTVLVKDAANNVTAYSTKSETTSTDTTAPVPGNTNLITASSITDRAFSLAWTAATDNATAAASLEYRVYSSTSAISDTVTAVEAETPLNSWTANLTSLNVTGLYASTTYYVNVIVRDGAGNKAVYATINPATIAGTAPSSAFSINSGAAYTTSAGVTLTISATTNIDQYRVAQGADCSGATWTSYGGGTLSLTLSGIDEAKTVCLQVRDAARNTSATSTQSITLDTTAPTPGGSSTLTTSVPGATSMKLTWATGTDNITTAANLTYRVFYSASNNIDTAANAVTNGTEYRSSTANMNYINVSGLAGATPYWFNVVVTDAAGNRAAYATATATTLAPATWTWVGGNDKHHGLGNVSYGTKGNAAASNLPGGRHYAAMARDAANNLWVFGGKGNDSADANGLLNDLWKFDGTNWTWISGSNLIDQAPSYGTKGVTDPSNMPGARYGSVLWTDASGNVWLFGGNGLSTSPTTGNLNDTWKFNTSTLEWTWMKGLTTRSAAPTAGTRGVAHAANSPAGREVPAFHQKATGEVWIFGGYRSGNCDFNDLWYFNGADWTWLSGGTEPSCLASVKGTLGVPDVANTPGGRTGASLWRETATGILWLFGGGNSNELWKYDPVGTTWTWINGDNTGAVKGTMGVAAAANHPGPTSKAAMWGDGLGNLFVFGGGGNLSNFLWQWNGTYWAWISGKPDTEDDSLAGFGVYGTKGIAAASNTPGARSATTFDVDSLGNVWIFGGRGWDSLRTDGDLNDLWKFNGSNWAWISGPPTIAQRGNYGTLNVAAASNWPGARAYSAFTSDNTGNMWMFGGVGVGDTQSVHGRLNDLWTFDGTNWTWLGGSKNADQAGNYGTKLVAAGSNMPGGRSDAALWRDSSGNIWLYGGEGYDSAGTYGVLGDLWKYDGTNWTWMHGANTVNPSKVTGAINTYAAANTPGALYGAVAWIDGSDALWLFGGSPATAYQWKFNGSQWQRTNTNTPSYGTRGVAAASNTPGQLVQACHAKDASGNVWVYGGGGQYQDLWKWDGANWTWVKGPGGVSSVYAITSGTKGVASTGNLPLASSRCSTWSNGADTVWIMPGRPYGNHYWYHWNRFFKFDGADWMWMTGTTGGEDSFIASVLGTRGVPATTNTPGRGRGSITWRDSSGNLFMFGGYIQSASTNLWMTVSGHWGYMNTLLRFTE